MASFVSTSIERLVNRIVAFAAILLMVLGFAAPVSAVEQNVFNYDSGRGIAREHITEISVAGTDALTPVRSAAPPVATHRVVLRPAVVLVAPRTTPSTAIEPMWAQAPNRGFLGGWSRPDTLKPGAVIDRYGGETGRFFSPQGTPLEARALPTGSGPLNTYEVLKPLDVQGGIVAPAFGQPGLGVQYMTDLPVADLIEQGFLKPVG